MTEPKKKYSDMYTLHNGDDVHFCPTCEYHLIDTSLNETFCPRCGQPIVIKRPILCKKVCNMEMIIEKEGNFYCKAFDFHLDTDINGEPIMSYDCKWD